MALIPASPRATAARRWSLARFIPIAELELIAFWQLKSGLLGDLVVGPIVYFALFAAGIGGVIGGGAAGDGGISRGAGDGETRVTKYQAGIASGVEVG